MNFKVGACLLAGCHRRALGPFLVASAAVSLASTYVSGRLADGSSRCVLVVAAMLATLAHAIALFALMAALAIRAAHGLDEVQAG